MVRYNYFILRWSFAFFYGLQDFKIQNIVGSCDVKFPIRLEGLAYSHGAFSSVSYAFSSPVFAVSLWLFIFFFAMINLLFSSTELQFQILCAINILWIVVRHGSVYIYFRSFWVFLKSVSVFFLSALSEWIPVLNAVACWLISIVRTRIISWFDIPNEAAKDCATHLCFWQDCSDWCEGEFSGRDTCSIHCANSHRTNFYLCYIFRWEMKHTPRLKIYTLSSQNSGKLSKGMQSLE